MLGVHWLVRAPIRLFRARLGFLFGGRMMMLEHIGRSSGRPRYVVLEIVDHPSPNRYIVASGFGTRAQWFRNIQADPHVRVTVGSHRPRAAVTHLMAPTDAALALRAYRAAHPRSWAALKTVVTETLGETVRDDGSNIPVVSIDLA
jgi:deazaflavin-dependent oxidoreductase (nitroreductase family)